jgi:hypothetical protein
VPGHHIIKLRSCNVAFVIEDVPIGLWTSEEQTVKAVMDHIPIDFMIASKP